MILGAERHVVFFAVVAHTVLGQGFGLNDGKHLVTEPGCLRSYLDQEILVSHCLNFGEIMASVSLRLPDEISRRLEHLVEITGRSKTYYMVEAIREHIDDLEDLYLAEQRLIDLRAGKTMAIPLEEVMKRYGLEG